MTLPIHPRDVAEVLRRVRDGRMPGPLGRVFGGRRRRVTGKWSGGGDAGTVRHWYELPAVVRRRNLLLTGDENLAPQQWIAERFLSNGGLRGLSLGCGTGVREIGWMETGAFDSLLGIDLSPSRIAEAERNGVGTGLGDRLRFLQGDALRDDPPDPPYDVVIVEGALHHLAPVERVVERMEQWLVPGGLLLVDEYVGPDRFQWSRAQLDLVNGLLGGIPERLRRTPEGRIRRSVWRPGRLTMRISDPSEAAESSRIPEVLERRFERIWSRGYGGTILQLLLKDIAHNFLDEGDQEAMEVLRHCFGREDEAMTAGVIGSDFLRGVYRRSTS